jgi:hypothetical protein
MKDVSAEVQNDECHILSVDSPPGKRSEGSRSRAPAGLPRESRRA